MTVTYSVVPRKNPAKKDESAKYYAQAQASGELDFEELCEGITSRSTCTETDVRAANVFPGRKIIWAAVISELENSLTDTAPSLFNPICKLPKSPSRTILPAFNAQASGELDFEELCEGITSRSTCTETDVRAAISGILYEAKRALKAGRIVRLGDLGSLQIGLNSEGAVSGKEFSSSLITAAHIIFRPGKTLADITKILSYQQVTTRAVAQTGGSGNEGEDDDKGSGGGSDGGGSGEAPDPAA